MKDLKIKKELIDVVYPEIKKGLGDNYKFSIEEEIIDFGDNRTITIYGLLFANNEEMLFEISLDNFAFKCKEWAVKYNFQLVSWTVAFEAVKKKGYCQTHNIQDKNRESDKPFREDTEAEAIIKACEWILEQIKCN